MLVFLDGGVDGNALRDCDGRAIRHATDTSHGAEGVFQHAEPRARAPAPPAPQDRAVARSRSSCAARPAPARSSWRARSTTSRGGRAVRPDQLRRAAARPDRERAVRPSPRRVLGRQRGPRRSDPARPPRHAVPRRDRRAAAGLPGRAAPRPPGGRGPSGRRQRRDVKVDVRVVAATHQDLPHADRRRPVPPGPLRADRRLRGATCRRCATAARTSAP